jgi:hypothetical protein
VGEEASLGHWDWKNGTVNNSLHFLFCFLYSRSGAEEADNSERLTDAEIKRKK